MISGKVIVASSAIVALAVEDMKESEMTPTADEGELSANVPAVGAKVMSGMLLSRIDPIYPASAKANHTSGTVITHALIGTDGHVHSLKLVSADDPDLAISAIAAVRQWVYKPYLLNGEPTDIETTITVNFEFGP